jgi:hypothetical protein
MTYPTNKAPTIRDLMPEGYLATLSERTGVKTITNLSQIVLREQTSSIHWAQVEKLAEQTNPDGFAAWKAAQPQPVAAD